MRGLTLVVEDEAMVVLVVQGIGCGSDYHVKNQRNGRWVERRAF